MFLFTFWKLFGKFFFQGNPFESFGTLFLFIHIRDRARFFIHEPLFRGILQRNRKYSQLCDGEGPKGWRGFTDPGDFAGSGLAVSRLHVVVLSAR